MRKGPKTREGGDFVRKYEVIFIVKPMEEDATNAVIDKFSKLIADNGGTIDKEDRWGKKRLAYCLHGRVRPRHEDHGRAAEAHDRSR